MKKYSGSIKRKFVINDVFKGDEGEYEVVFFFELNGFEFKFKNMIYLYVVGGNF